MKYMINVDLETKNVSGGATDCQSELHEAFGRHFDLTVHSIGCACRRARARTVRPLAIGTTRKEMVTRSTPSLSDSVRFSPNTRMHILADVEFVACQLIPPHWD